MWTTRPINSSDGIVLSRMEDGNLNVDALLTRSSSEHTKSTWSQFYVDFFTAISSPTRRFRAIYVLFDALYFASAADDDSLTPFREFFFANFSFTLVDMAVSTAYLAYCRHNGVPYKVTNANAFTDFFETTASVLGIGMLIQDPYYTVTVSREQQWVLISIALFIAVAQIIPGVDGKPWGKGVAHSLHEAWARFPKEQQKTSFILRLTYLLLRFLHAAHVLTIQYSLSDAIALLFQANPFLAYAYNANKVAAPISFLFLVSSRLVLYALYSKKVPSWALKVAMFERVLYALNNSLFALNAFAYFITLARLVIENKPGSSYIYDSFLQSLTVFVPAFLVAIAVFATAWREYNENFIFELERRVAENDFDQDACDENLQRCLDQVDQDPERIISSGIAEALAPAPTRMSQWLETLDKLSGPLQYRDICRGEGSEDMSSPRASSLSNISLLASRVSVFQKPVSIVKNNGPHCAII